MSQGGRNEWESDDSRRCDFPTQRQTLWRATTEGNQVGLVWADDNSIAELAKGRTINIDESRLA
jgi:hypothetical protein